MSRPTTPRSVPRPRSPRAPTRVPTTHVVDEEDESRDQLGAIGSRLPLHNNNRRKTYSSGTRSTGNSSVGTRSTGGSSVGSGSARSQTDGGSEAASVDNFGAHQGADDKGDPLAFGQHSAWPGEHVKALFKGSSHWSRPRELIPAVIFGAQPLGSAAALKGGMGMGAGAGGGKGKHVSSTTLLSSLRELSAHLSTGYGWPGASDRVPSLCWALHGLLGEFKGSSSSNTSSVGQLASVFGVGSKDQGAENKVVRLIYAHLACACNSDAAITSRRDAAFARGTAPLLLAANHSRSAFLPPRPPGNHSTLSRSSTAASASLPPDVQEDAMSAASLGMAASIGLYYFATDLDASSSSSSGATATAAAAGAPPLLRGLSFPDHGQVLTMLASAEAELLVLHDCLPRRCLAATLYVSLAILASGTGPSGGGSGGDSGGGLSALSSVSRRRSVGGGDGGGGGGGGGGGLALDVALKQLPPLVRSATSPANLALPAGAKVKLKQRRVFEDNQLLLTHLLAGVRHWVQEALQRWANLNALARAHATARHTLTAAAAPAAAPPPSSNYSSSSSGSDSGNNGSSSSSIGMGAHGNRCPRGVGGDPWEDPAQHQQQTQWGEQQQQQQQQPRRKPHWQQQPGEFTADGRHKVLAAAVVAAGAAVRGSGSLKGGGGGKDNGVGGGEGVLNEDDLADGGDAVCDDLEQPLELLKPLVAAAFALGGCVSVSRQALHSLSLLGRADPSRLATCLRSHLLPLQAPAAHLTAGGGAPSASEHSSSSSSSSGGGRKWGRSNSSGNKSGGGVAVGGTGGGGGVEGQQVLQGGKHAWTTDVLCCVYFLRCCSLISFAPLACWSPHSGFLAEGGAEDRTCAYAVLVSSLADPRARVCLEILRCLTAATAATSGASGGGAGGSRWWRALEASVTPPPPNSVLAMGLTEDGSNAQLVGLVARAGAPTAGYCMPSPPPFQSNSFLASLPPPPPPPPPVYPLDDPFSSSPSFSDPFGVASPQQQQQQQTYPQQQQQQQQRQQELRQQTPTPSPPYSSITATAAGRQAVEGALGRLQAAVARGSGGWGGGGVDGRGRIGSSSSSSPSSPTDSLSLHPIPRCRDALLRLLTQAAPRAESSRWSTTTDGSSSSSSSSRQGGGGGSGGETSSSSSSSSSGGGGGGNSSSSNGSSNLGDAEGGGGVVWSGWDGVRMDDVLAHSVLRACSDFGKCFAGRRTTEAMTGHASNSRLPSTDLSTAEIRQQQQAAEMLSGHHGCGGGVAVSGFEELAGVFAASAPPSNSDRGTHPPPPVGFKSAAAVRRALGGDGGGGGDDEDDDDVLPTAGEEDDEEDEGGVSEEEEDEDENNVTTRMGGGHGGGGFADRNAASPLTSPLRSPPSPSSPSSPSSLLVREAARRSRACMREVAEAILFGSHRRDDHAPSPPPPTTPPPATAAAAASATAGASALVGALSHGSVWGPLLHPSAPWPLRVRALEALVWLATHHENENNNTNYATHSGTAGHPKGSSRLGDALCPGGGRAGGTWVLVRGALLAVGPGLPLASLVELVDCLTSRLMVDAAASLNTGSKGRERRRRRHRCCHRTRSSSFVAGSGSGSGGGGGVGGGNDGYSVGGWRGPGDAAVFASMEAALSVAVAWFKSAPCDVLGEALRRVWEATIAILPPHRQQQQQQQQTSGIVGSGSGSSSSWSNGNGSSSSTTTNQNKHAAEAPWLPLPRASVAAHAKAEAWGSAYRRLILSSLFDVLDWRLLRSRPPSFIGGGGTASDPVTYRSVGMPATESWSAVGASPSLARQWAAMQRGQRRALRCLGNHALVLEGFDGGGGTSCMVVPTATATEEAEAAAGTEHAAKTPGPSTNTATTAATATTGMLCWDPAHALSSVAVRLRKGCLTEGNLATRRCCAQGLCRLALAAQDPQRFALYCILSDLQLAASPPPPPPPSSTSAHLPRGDRDDDGGEDDGEDGGGDGSWLGVADVLSPVLCYLDHSYAVAEAALHGTKLEDEFVALGTTPKALEQLRLLLG